LRQQCALLACASYYDGYALRVLHKKAAYNAVAIAASFRSTQVALPAETPLDQPVAEAYNDATPFEMMPSLQIERHGERASGHSQGSFPEIRCQKVGWFSV
jgi:hypothetical protein